jgi:hypothetical protein
MRVSPPALFERLGRENKKAMTVMTPALLNILKLVEGSDELEDAHAMQILLQSIKTLAEKGLGRSLELRRIHQ